MTQTQMTTTAYSFGDIYIEGKWQAGSAARPLDVVSPWTGETIARIAAADASDVDRAFHAAARAQLAWAAKLPSERRDVFLRAARILESRRGEVVDWLVREAGSTL